jgi:hypothetical protein
MAHWLASETSGCPEAAGNSHPASFGAAHRFSQPPSSFFLSPPSRHISDGWRSWGSHPTGVCSSREAPTAHRRRHTLLTLLLQIGQGPRPREGPSAGTPRRCLGSQLRRLSRLQGFRPRGSRSAPWNMISVSSGRPTPHGLPPPHGVNRRCWVGFRLTAIVLHSQQVRRQTHQPLHFMACHHLKLTFSHKKVIPSRGSSPSITSSVWKRPGAGLFGLRLLASVCRIPHETVQTSLHHRFRLPPGGSQIPLLHQTNVSAGHEQSPFHWASDDRTEGSYRAISRSNSLA